MIVLGINEAHNASAALAVDGEIIAAAQEERFTRQKNHFGVPYQAIKFCLDFANTRGGDVDLIVFSGGVPTFLTNVKTSGLDLPAYPLLKLAKNIHSKVRLAIIATEYHFPLLRGIDKNTIEPINILTRRIFFPKTAQILEKKFGLRTSAHVYLDHHTAHAYTALYSSGFTHKYDQILVVTCDGGGDGLSATVSVFKNGTLRRIAVSTQDNSLGCLYGCITDILGMESTEHEYKVMGLAPYARGSDIEKIYEFLKSVIKLDQKSLSWQTVVASDNLNRYLREHLPKYRFDNLAAAVQKLTEQLLTAWIKAAIERTGVKNVVFGGGVAANVKANQKIAQIPTIGDLFVMPSAGDESNSIGCAYWGTQKLNPKVPLIPLKNLYLGPSYRGKEIEHSLKRLKSKKYKITKIKNQKEQALLLAQGQVLARFSGRLEFGARALGNRSILADPMATNISHILNRQIKSRDFWMPFAPTILSQDAQKYLDNPKKVKSPFMTFAFDTKKSTQQQLAAAIHPYDHTARAQILARDNNPTYHNLISEFKKITGRGAILNTSFNLHGEPIVCSPSDAISTFAKSGLKYLALEDFLIEKID